MFLDGLTGKTAVTNTDADIPVENSQYIEGTKEFALSQVAGVVKSYFQQAKDARNTVEAQWLTSMKQWRGEHSATELAAISRRQERNPYTVYNFIKITKTKATAALGQIIDLVFDNDRIPISIQPTTVPEGGVEDVVHLQAEQAKVPAEMLDPYGYAGDGRDVEPGADTRSMLGSMAAKIQDYLSGKKVVKGPSPDPQTSPVLTPAAEAAYRMEKTVVDQLEEYHFQREARRAFWQMVVLGTGVMKGPMTKAQVNHRWKKNEYTGANEYVPEVIKKPVSTYVSCWNFYPDPYATRIEDAAYVVEKHRYSPDAFAELRRYEGFDKQTIDYLISRGPAPIVREWWEDSIRDVTNIDSNMQQFEVLEYWGVLDRKFLEPLKDVLGDDIEEGLDQYHVNVWICQDRVIRLIINPFVPVRIPYYATPYEEHPEQIWGISLPQNMEDVQRQMNVHYDMLVDNLAFSGNCVFEINETYLADNQDASVYPGKIFKTTGPLGQAIRSITFNNTSQQHMMAFDKARQIADEVTGQPSYAHGGTATTGSTRTASGMSMLMSAAAGNIRQVVKNVDEYMLKPIGEAYFNWNMQHNDDLEIKGDVRVVAGGTASLIKRELMSQRILQYMQVAGGVQPLAIQTNWNYVNKEFARSLGLDSDKLQADSVTMALNAEMLAKMGPAPAGGAQAAQGATDQTGGQMAPGAGTTPGEQQFTANAQSQ